MTSTAIHLKCPNSQALSPSCLIAFPQKPCPFFNKQIQQFSSCPSHTCNTPISNPVSCIPPNTQKKQPVSNAETRLIKSSHRTEMPSLFSIFFSRLPNKCSTQKAPSFYSQIHHPLFKKERHISSNQRNKNNEFSQRTTRASTISNDYHENDSH